MSFSQHLKSQKNSYLNSFKSDIKGKKSLIFEDASTLSRIEVFKKCKEGFDNLCKLDKKFEKFDNLFCESDLNTPLTLLEESDVEKIKADIRCFLYLLTDFLETKCALSAVEWLIFKHEAHLHQPEDVLSACFPLHDKPIFVKFLRLLNLEPDSSQPQFALLKAVSDSGRPLSSEGLSALCLKSAHFLEMLCSWPSRITAVTQDDSGACRGIYTVLFTLTMSVLDKVKLRGSEKIEKYMSPFIRLVNDGLKSRNSDFMSTATMILFYMAQNIAVNEHFLKDCLKRLLKPNVLSDYVALKAALNLSSLQDFKLSEKMETLFTAKKSNLSEEETRKIEDYINNNENDNDDEEDNSNAMETSICVDSGKPNESKERSNKNVQKKHSVIIEELINSLNIDLKSNDIEDRLTEVLYRHVLNWRDEKTSKKNLSGKISKSVLSHLIKTAKSLKITYKKGGIVSVLCVVLLSPLSEERKAVKKLLHNLIVDWPSISCLHKIGKGELSEGYPGCLTRGDIAVALLAEIEPICTDESPHSVKSAAISLINEETITSVALLSNVWNIFLSSVTPKSVCSVADLALAALASLRDTFPRLDYKDQMSIIDSVTSNLDSSAPIINKAVENLSKISLSVDNIKYLLQESPSSPPSLNRGQLIKCVSSAEVDNEFYNENVRYKIIAVLGAISRIKYIKEVELIQLVQPLFVILRRTFMSEMNITGSNKVQINTKNDMILLLSNLMSAILSILSHTESKISDKDKLLLSNKMKLEEISKCLYIFNNTQLQNLVLMVIQKLVRLEMGLEHFNLAYFMNWLGSNVIPRDDQHSMNILNSVLEETLPVCIKVKLQSENVTCDQVKIIADFVKDCSSLPKHRSIMLYHNLVKSLSTTIKGDKCSVNSTLWIQLIFMVIKKGTENLSSIPSVNECLILPLLKKFSKEEQLYSIKVVVSFLARLINDPSKKRKLFIDDISNESKKKKRKIDEETGLVCENIKLNDIVENEFITVKEYLLSSYKNLDCVTLLKTIMKYFLMHLNENNKSMLTVPSDLLTDVISSLFTSMKLISCSTMNDDLKIQNKNELIILCRQIIETVGSSLTQNKYLSLIINIVRNSSDESLKLKALELLSIKLAVIDSFSHGDVELINIISLILSTSHEIILNNNTNQTGIWDCCVSCATSVISMGLLEENLLKEHLEKIYNCLIGYIENNLTILSVERVILINLFFKKYVSGDNGNELVTVFKASLKVMGNCLEKRQINNGEMESSLALFHAILSRDDAQTVGWQLFESLLRYIFELTRLECLDRKMSKSSIEYQKNIRTKLSKMHDTNAMIQVCINLLNEGYSLKNMVFISGSISLFGCHLAHLNKSHVKWNLSDHGTEQLWTLVLSLLSVAENFGVEGKAAEQVRLCEEVSIKAVIQLCYIFEFDQAVISKITVSWSQQEKLNVATYLSRNSLLFRLFHHMSIKSTNSTKIIDFINNSDIFTFASAFLKHIIVDLNEKKAKKRKRTENMVVIPFSKEELTGDCPKQCLALVESIAAALHAHLSAENKNNLNLNVSDETINLIVNVCATLISIEHYVSKDEYLSVSEKFLIPLIVQLAVNSYNDEALLSPLCMALSKYFSELSNSVHLAILKVLSSLKEVLGVTFESSIKKNISSFLEDCKLHDDETIADLANAI